MKIAFISVGYYPEHPGGASVSTRLIVDELRRRGVEVTVFTTTGTGTRIREITEEHYELPNGTGYPLPDRVGKNYTALKHLPDEEYDLIHVYGLGPLPGVVSRCSVPVLGTANNLEWVCINWTDYLRAGCPEYGLRYAISLARQDGYGALLPFKIGMEAVGKRLSKQADHLTVQTDGMSRILQRCGYPAGNLTTVPNLLDPQFEVDEAENDNELLYIGRLVDKKGAPDIVGAYTDLPAEIRENWAFRIFGNGPEKERIQRIASRSDSEISVEYCPYERLPEVYGRASVLVHGSKYPEPFSRTWLEAMASETSIVASENPSSRAVLSDSAELYDPFDKEDLRESLLSVLSEEAKRSRLRENALKSLENYRIETVVSSYLDIYEDITDKQVPVTGV